MDATTSETKIVRYLPVKRQLKTEIFYFLHGRRAQISGVCIWLVDRCRHRHVDVRVSAGTTVCVCVCACIISLIKYKIQALLSEMIGFFEIELSLTG